MHLLYSYFISITVMGYGVIPLRLSTGEGSGPNYPLLHAKCTHFHVIIRRALHFGVWAFARSKLFGRNAGLRTKELGSCRLLTIRMTVQ